MGLARSQASTDGEPQVPLMSRPPVLLRLTDDQKVRLVIENNNE